MNRYIKVTKTTEKEVLNILHNLRYRWVGGDVATEYSAFTGRNNTSEMYIRIKNGYLSCCSCIPDYIEITLEELRAMVAPRKVTKLSDLNNIVNSEASLKLSMSPCGKSVVMSDLILKPSTHILTIHKLNQNVVDILNKGGFNLVYKPPRTKEDILKEIETLSEIPNENEDRYRIGFDYPRIGKFNIWKIDTNGLAYPRLRGLKKEDAKRLCDELNRI